MASVTPTFTSTNDDAQIATWSTMTSSNVDGSSISSVKYPDRTVQFSGTFNGATCILQGSNDNSNFFTLTNPAGTSISMTAAGIQAVVESPLWIKPSTSGGGGSQSVNCILVSRGTNPRNT